MIPLTTIFSSQQDVSFKHDLAEELNLCMAVARSMDKLIHTETPHDKRLAGRRDAMLKIVERLAVLYGIRRNP